MQKFISKYGLAAHLAILAVAPLFLFPFFGPSAVAMVLLWLSADAMLWVMLEPSRRSGEMLHDARSRVAVAMLKDPLLWVSLAVVVMAGVRWANGGIAMAYDAEALEWYIKEPPLAFFPGCAVGAGELPFAGAVAVAVLMQGCRHALGKSARVFFLVASSFLAAVAAVAAIALGAAGHEGAKGFTECGLACASYPGMSFGLYFLAGLAGLAGAFERKWNRYTLLFSFAIGGCAAGLYFFAPPFTIVVFAAAGLLLLAYSAVYVGFEVGSVDACKCLVAVLIAASVPVLCAMGMGTGGVNEARLASVSEGGSLFPATYRPLGDLLSSIAAKVWQVHPWTGTGIGTFSLDVRFNATAADWSLIPHGLVTALNGWWYVLAERGIIGALVFALVGALLLFTFVWRLVASFKLRFYHPACLLGLVALAAAGTDSFFGASFLRPEATAAVAALLATAASAFPTARKAGAEAETAG